MKAIGPNLSFMHGVDAFAERFDGLVTENYAMGPESERVNYKGWVARTEEHYRARPCLKFTQLTQDAKTFERSVLQFRADYDDIGLNLFDERKRVSGSDGASNDSDTITPRSKSRFDQLAVHFVRFCHQNIYNRTPHLPYPLLSRPRAALESGRV